MKADIGSVEATAANVHDSQVLPKLLHGWDTRVGGFSLQRATRHDPVVRAHGQEFHPDEGASPSATK